MILNTAFEYLLEHGFPQSPLKIHLCQNGYSEDIHLSPLAQQGRHGHGSFPFRIGAGIEFPRKFSYVESIRLQMLALAKAFRGPFGAMIKALLGEAQFDAELAEAFRTRWITARREAAKEVIQSAMRNKELRPHVDLDQALDALYGGLLYRLMIGSGSISDACVRGIFSAVLGRFAGSGELEGPRSFLLHSYLKKDCYLR